MEEKTVYIGYTGPIGKGKSGVPIKIDFIKAQK